MTRPIALVLLLTACPSPDPITDTDSPDVPEPQCAGFASTAQTWAVAEPFLYDYFMDSRDGEGSYWSLFDLDGDGFLDLLQHHHGNHADAEVMRANWYVWWGDGERFGEQTWFSLPMDHRDISGLASANDLERVLDINGDGLADLVIATDPETRDIWDAEGERHWRAYLGEGRGGFAATPTRWTVPDLVDGAVHSKRTGGKRWTTFDIDGDGVVELVHTTSAETAGNWGFDEGDPHWRIYRNTGTGFEAEPERWQLPDSPTGYDGWYATHTDGAYRTVRTEDVTGDGLPDLISPTDSAWPNPVWGADDTPHWRVHPNTGDGFDKEWIEWRIPSADLPFPGSAGDWMRETSMDWDTLTIGGGWPALVTATDPESGDPLTDADGNPAWHVYRNTGAGFAVEPSPWRVPDPVFATFWSSGGAAAEGWTTVDLTGDGCLDLVLTSGLDIAHPTEPGAAWAWQVWPGE